jgi:hypothetical protein
MSSFIINDIFCVLSNISNGIFMVKNISFEAHNFGNNRICLQYVGLSGIEQKSNHLFVLHNR